MAFEVGDIGEALAGVQGEQKVTAWLAARKIGQDLNVVSEFTQKSLPAEGGDSISVPRPRRGRSGDSDTHGRFRKG